MKYAFLAVLALSMPSLSNAAAAHGYSTDEIAIQKVSEKLLQNDLKFVTEATNNICGTTGIEGTDVKVQVAAQGRYITIRHYGVTYAGFFAREKAVECSK